MRSPVEIYSTVAITVLGYGQLGDYKIIWVMKNGGQDKLHGFQPHNATSCGIVERLFVWTAIKELDIFCGIYHLF